MAKIEDDMEFDDEMEFGDDGFDTEGGSDDRDPIRANVEDFKDSFLDDFKDTSKVDQAIEIGGAFATAFTPKSGEVADTYSGIVDDLDKNRIALGKGVTPLMDMLPKDDDSMIGNVANKVRGLLGITSEATSGGNDVKSDDSIANDYASQFGDSLKIDVDLQTQLADIQKNTYEAGTNALLTQMIKSDQLQLKGFSVSSKYYQKSIELKYRHLLESKTSNKILLKMADRVDKHLQIIGDNSYLPDLVKMKSSEALTANLRQEMAKSLYTRIAGSNNWMKRLRTNVNDKVTAGVSGMESAMSMMSMPVEMYGTMKDSGMGGSAGSMVGGMAAGTARSGLGGLMSNVLKRSKYGRQLAESIENRLGDPTETLDKLSNMKYVGGGFGFLKDLIGENPQGNIEELKGESKDANEATSFDYRTHSSINKVIPQLLSKILTNVEGIRSGDDPSLDDELFYDHGEGKFIRKSEMSSGVKKALGNVYDDSGFSANTNVLLNKLKTNNEIVNIAMTKDDEKIILKELMRINRKGMRLTQTNIDTLDLFPDANEEDKAKYIEILKNGLKTVKDGELVEGDLLSRGRTLDQYANVNNDFDMSGLMQERIESGYGDELVKMGVVDYDEVKKRYVINKDKYFDVLDDVAIDKTMNYDIGNRVFTEKELKNLAATAKAMGMDEDELSALLKLDGEKKERVLEGSSKVTKVKEQVDTQLDKVAGKLDDGIDYAKDTYDKGKEKYDEDYAGKSKEEIIEQAKVDIETVKETSKDKFEEVKEDVKTKAKDFEKENFKEGESKTDFVKRKAIEIEDVIMEKAKESKRIVEEKVEGTPKAKATKETITSKINDIGEFLKTKFNDMDVDTQFNIKEKVEAKSQETVEIIKETVKQLDEMGKEMKDTDGKPFSLNKLKSLSKRLSIPIPDLLKLNKYGINFRDITSLAKTSPKTLGNIIKEKTKPKQFRDEDGDGIRKNSWREQVKEGGKRTKGIGKWLFERDVGKESGLMGKGLLGMLGIGGSMLGGLMGVGGLLASAFSTAITGSFTTMGLIGKHGVFPLLKRVLPILGSGILSLVGSAGGRIGGILKGGIETLLSTKSWKAGAQGTWSKITGLFSKIGMPKTRAGKLGLGMAAVAGASYLYDKMSSVDVDKSNEKFVNMAKSLKRRGVSKEQLENYLETNTKLDSNEIENILEKAGYESDGSALGTIAGVGTAGLVAKKTYDLVKMDKTALNAVKAVNPSNTGKAVEGLAKVAGKVKGIPQGAKSMLGKFSKKLPFVAGAASMYDAYGDIKDGNYGSAATNAIIGMLSLFPATALMGTIGAVGKMGYDYFTDETDEEKQERLAKERKEKLLEEEREQKKALELLEKEKVDAERKASPTNTTKAEDILYEKLNGKPRSTGVRDVDLNFFDGLGTNASKLTEHFDDVEVNLMTQSGIKMSFKVSKEDKMLLEHIARHESAVGQKGYKVTYGNGKYLPKHGKNIDITKLPLHNIIDIMDLQVRLCKLKGSKHISSAMGKYQFIKKTLLEMIKLTGIDESTIFNADTQDYLILQRLIKTRGYNKWKKGTITDKKFVHNLACEFASIEDPYLGTGHYGGQKARNSAKSFYELFKRMKNEKGERTSNVTGTETVEAVKATVTKTNGGMVSVSTNRPSIQTSKTKSIKLSDELPVDKLILAENAKQTNSNLISGDYLASMDNTLKSILEVNVSMLQNMIKDKELIINAIDNTNKISNDTKEKEKVKPNKPIRKHIDGTTFDVSNGMV